MVRNITSQSDFNKSIDVPSLVVVDFYGDWCGPCRRIAPAVEQLSHKYPEVVFLKVNDKECPDLVMSSGIRAFPTFQFFVKGRKVDEMKGADESMLERKVIQWKGEAGTSSFSGQGNTLGGWDGVGQPPGTGGNAAQAREARLKALEQRSSAATSSPSVPSGGEDTELQKALELSLAQDAGESIISQAQSGKKSAKMEEGFLENSKAVSSYNVEMVDGEEMIPVPVDETLLTQLLEMGFSDTRGRKGLVHGKNSLDGALAWLGEHEDDPDIDQPYLVKKSDAEKEMTPKVPLTPEEKERRIAEMKAKIEKKRKEREEAEKVEKIKREKERREQGKSIESIQEERDRLMRKREIERKKKEKEDEKKERERLRAEIARDKEMRRANKGVLPSVLGVEGYNPSVGATDKELGKPGGSASDDSAVAAPSPAVVPDPSSTVRSSTAPSAPASLSTSTAETKESIMRSVDGALTTICRYRTGGDGGQALKMLTLYIQNIVQNPSESKYQTINMESKAFKSKIVPFVGTMQLLKAIGFVKNDDEHKLLLPSLDIDIFGETLAKLQEASRIYNQVNGF